MTDWAFDSVSSGLGIEQYIALWNQRGKLLAGALNGKRERAGVFLLERHGARGNGLKDDTAAIASAIAAAADAGAGTVTGTPGKTYLVSTTTATPCISVPSYVDFDGGSRYGTTFKLAAGAPNASSIIGTASGATGVRIRGLTLDGNRANQTLGNYGALLTNTTFSTLDVRVINTKSHGIVGTTNCTDILVYRPEVVTWGFGAGEGFGILFIDGALRCDVWKPYVSGFGSASVGICMDGSLDDGSGAACDGCSVFRGFVTGCAINYSNEDSHRTHWIDCTGEAWTNINFLNQPGQANRMPIGVRNIRPVMRNGAATGGVGHYDCGNDSKVLDPQCYNMGGSRAVKRALPPVALRPSYDFECDGMVLDGSTEDAFFAEEGKNIRFTRWSCRNMTGGSAANLVPAAPMSVVKIGGGSFAHTLSNSVANTAAVQVTGGTSTLTHLSVGGVTGTNIGVVAAQDVVSIVTGGTVDKVKVRGISGIDTQGAPTTRNVVNVLGAITTIRVDDLDQDGITGALLSTDTATNQIGGVSRELSATKTWDPANTADGAMTSTTITVTGAVVGDPVRVGFTPAVPAGAVLSGSVTAADTVTVTLLNKTGGALDLASGTLRADVGHH